MAPPTPHVSRLSAAQGAQAGPKLSQPWAADGFPGPVAANQVSRVALASMLPLAVTYGRAGAGTGSLPAAGGSGDQAPRAASAAIAAPAATGGQ